MTEAGWLALATIIVGGLVKIWADVRAVHGLVNSEMEKARAEMIKAINLADELAFARGFEQGGKEARETSASVLVAAAAALPPVVVPSNTEPRETHGGGWVMTGPDPNPQAQEHRT